MTQPERATYAFGHTDHERRRISLQAAILNPLTEQFLRRAGITEGMRVLDLGCGVGDVSLILAKLVGPHGYVTGIDIDGPALEIARVRAQQENHDHLTFEQNDAGSHRPEHLYDAVAGRLILIHTADPLNVLRNAVAMLHKGGIIAFQDIDLSVIPSGYPELPLTLRCQGLIAELFRRVTPHANIGARLFYLMQEAGLPPPECRGECVIDGGPESPFFEWLAETIRSSLPRLEAFDLAKAADLDVDTLAARLRNEAVSRRGCMIVSPLVGAFARKP
jgi:SAM-dependent methyltransferase